MSARTFHIDTSSTGSVTCWAELHDGRLEIHQTSELPGEKDDLLLEWDVDVLRNLLAWASQEKEINVTFTGPMAHLVRQHSKELGMTSEMFVWHAVKLFIEAGTAQ